MILTRVSHFFSSLARSHLCHTRPKGHHSQRRAWRRQEKRKDGESNVDSETNTVTSGVEHEPGGVKPAVLQISYLLVSDGTLDTEDEEKDPPILDLDESMKQDTDDMMYILQRLGHTSRQR